MKGAPQAMPGSAIIAASAADDSSRDRCQHSPSVNFRSNVIASSACICLHQFFAQSPAKIHRCVAFDHVHQLPKVRQVVVQEVWRRA